MVEALMNISFDYYRIFYYVAKCGNFTQAANLMMNNQPNITRTIRNLENALGCSLFIRSNRGVTLTPEGQQLYAHVKIAMEHIIAGEQELTQISTLQTGTISIGASEVALHCFLLPILKEFQQLHPGIRLKVSNHSTPQAIAALREDTVDIAFVTSPIGQQRGLTISPLKNYHETAVCGSAFGFLTGSRHTLEDLTQYPLVSLAEHTGTYAFLSNLFSENGLTFSPDIEAATADQILPMVRNNLGIGFVPEEFLEQDNSGDIYRLDLTTAIPHRSICCVQKAGTPMSIAAKELVRMVFAHSAYSGGVNYDK